MARKGTTATSTGGSPKQLAIGFLDSVTSLWISCAKKASRVSRNIRVKSISSRVTPNSPLAKPKQFLAKISHKATHFRCKKRPTCTEEEFDLDAESGDKVLWQRTILMGDKCQPLDFSGVIHYDRSGRQLPEVPMRSPRASPLPRYL